MTTESRTPAGESVAETPAAKPEPDPPPRRRITLGLYRFGALYVLITLFIVFSILRPETFFSGLNVRVMLISQSVLAITALGLLFAASCGEFDLSLGYLSGFSGMLAAWLMTVEKWPVPLAVLVAIAAAALVGTLNGFLVVRIGIDSFIATLGTGTILSGLTLWVSNGRVLFDLPKSFINLGQGRLFQTQLPVYVMLIVILVAAYVFHLRAVGRHMYATGGNRPAARMAGVRTARLVWISLLMSSLLGGIGGVLFAANAGAASPEAGVELLLPAFAAVFLGSTTIFPGRFNVFGTVTALFLLVVLVNGIQQLGAPHWIQPVFNGLALLIAVGLATFRKKNVV